MIQSINRGVVNARGVTSNFDKALALLNEVALGTGTRLYVGPTARAFSMSTVDGGCVEIVLTREIFGSIQVDLKKWFKHPSGNMLLTYSRKKIGYKGAYTALIDMLNMIAANETKGKK